MQKKTRKLTLASQLLCLSLGTLLLGGPLGAAELESAAVKPLELPWPAQSTQYLPLTDGHQIPYLWLEQTNAQATLVIVNGRTETLLKYQELAQHFLAQGYNVLLFDHRGQGLSARYTDDPFKGHIDEFQTYVDDMHQLLQRVLPEPRQHKLLLLAHSMGGAVSSLYLEQHPEVFAAAALSAPMHGIQGKLLFSENDACALGSLMSVFSSEGYAGFAAAPFKVREFAGNDLTGSRSRFDWFNELNLQYPQIQLGGPTWGWLAQSCAVFEPMRANSSSLQIPLLVLQAELDTVVSNRAQNEFCQALQQNPESGCVTGGPVVIQGALHEVLFEQDKQRQQSLTYIDQHFAKALAQ
ncbi:alpha/beta fold hydrolase [Rheinheimera sp.]|uniref:alpha/beta fold hydrolase n=1 Tax=Rheinheimera sp. TaxID=1869214 RepID=UPI00307D8E4A